MKRLIITSVLLLSMLPLAAGSQTGLRETIARTHTVLSEDEWFGFHRVKFDFQGFTAWVVEPRKAGRELKGARPWTWTMQWAEAYVDRTGVPDLLKEGYHHVTIEAYSTKADESGLKLFADFQEFLVGELGFDAQANLVGMSWGGFFSVRYADAYPQNVRRIYLDAPLLTFKDWGRPDPDRIGPWATDPSAAGSGWEKDPRMPVNMSESIAKAGIPILLLYGGQDQTVDPKLNCELFIERFKAAGGKCTIVKRSLFGHHPHGLDPDKTKTITDFFKN